MCNFLVDSLSEVITFLVLTIGGVLDPKPTRIITRSPVSIEF
jgi:hypothetical protein